jgi:ferric-dicitrate binding protein FerR (iron transport regulator)
LKENFNDINNDLLVRYLLNETDSEERLQAEEWIAASDNNRKYFEDFKLIWEQSKSLSANSSINENDAWQRFRQRVQPTEKKPAIVRSVGYKFQWTKIAALLAVVTIVTWLMTVPGNKTITVESHQAVLASTLPDGSVVTLNKNAVLSYAGKFKGEERNVNLQGEAFFAVTPDKKKPFVIHVNDVTVKVVGTSFNIKSSNGHTEVIVETGIVQVTRNGRTIELRPKEKTIVTAQDTVLQKEVVADKLYDYYRSKEFVCNNTPLWKLVATLNEAYNVNITIERPALRNLPITTTFSNKPLDSVLAVIGQTLDATIVHENNQIILK